ncbi:MAG TPA: NAD-binding protein [Nitrospiraceae bacterium]|nr:NAD-binding protein [Nitrospiraceae bacterium]
MVRYQRLVVAFMLVVGVNFALATGYWFLNFSRSNPDGSGIDFLQCLYMTVVTTFTVGYGEIVPVVTPLDRIYTMFVIVLGLGTMGYGISQMTAFFVQGELRGILARHEMEKTIKALHDHFIICGTGDVGHYVIEELLATRRSFVAIDTEEDQLKRLAEQTPFPYLVGDATDEAVLVHAGVKVAAGVICALPNDRDNLVLAMTCRMLNVKLRIVAKAHDIKLSQRVKNAGADAVVSPQFIGGMRLVSEMVRPTVVSFLDLMLRDRDKEMRVEELQIKRESRLAGKQLDDRELLESEVLVMALQPPGVSTFTYVPSRDAVLAPDTTLIVLGDAKHVTALRKKAESGH